MNSLPLVRVFKITFSQRVSCSTHENIIDRYMYYVPSQYFHILLPDLEVGSPTKLYDISYSPHNDKANPNGSADAKKFVLVGYDNQRTLPVDLEKTVVFQRLMERHTLCTPVHELCAFFQEISWNIGQFFDLV